MTRLIQPSYDETLQEANRLAMDARKYPKGSHRRSDLYREALEMVRQWHRDRPQEKDRSDETD